MRLGDGIRIGLLVTVLAAAADLPAQPVQQARLERIDRWQSVLPGATVKPRFRIAAGDPQAVRLAWELTARHRTIRRGGQRLPAGKGPHEVAIELEIPQLNDGVSLELELSVWLEDAAGQRIGEALGQTLWILAADPFAGASRRLEELQIVLFDPQKSTIERFEAAKIPFRLARGNDALAVSEEGLVVIGEGVSFETNRGLIETLRTLVRHGRRVVVLAPAAGTLVLSEGEKGEIQPALRSLHLRRRDIISEFDKRLDAAAWLDFELPDGRLGVELGGDGLALEIAGNQLRWSYVELTAQDSTGGMVVCDLPVIGRWDSGPTPRYLLAHLLGLFEPDKP